MCSQLFTTQVMFSETKKSCFPEIRGVCPNLRKSFPQKLKQKMLNWKGRGSPLKMTLDGKSEEKSIENNHFAENLIVRGSCHAHF